MDYKKLLEKYMKHVLDCEGTDFTIDLNTNPAVEVKFTDEEVKELLAISDTLEP